jgi:NAD(P)-dependent dehydrogenase (short-subunit alcohol dehydrogenase family)
VTWHPQQVGQRTGCTFVVTGANSGIGLEAARDLVGRGAHVVLAVRDMAKGEEAAASLAGPGSTSVVELDLSDLDQIGGCAKTLLDRHDNLSALICNAGVMGGPFLLTPQGFERQMATNHLGHAALVAELWPLLHASGSRVVLVSSHEARGGQLSPRTTQESCSTRRTTKANRSTGTPNRPTCCSRRSYTAVATRPVRRSAPAVRYRCAPCPRRHVRWFPMCRHWEHHLGLVRRP